MGAKHQRFTCVPSRCTCELCFSSTDWIFLTALSHGIPHPNSSVGNFKCGKLVVDEKEDVMLRMRFGDDVAAVDAASSSHFVPLSAMIRNHKVSDRLVLRENRGPEHRLLSEATRKTDRLEDSVGSSPICSNASHRPLGMAFKD
ncbi:uncharacterized protein ACNS7B_023205 isoform 2-T2 [Menidia menidia]